MTAQAVAPPLPPDPAPAPPAAAEAGSGNHFLAVFGAQSSTPAQPAGAAKDPAAAAVPTAIRGVALRKLRGASEQGTATDQAATAAPSNGTDPTAAVIALPLPLLVQLQQAVAAGGTSPSVAPTLPAAAVTNGLPLPAPLAAVAAATGAPPASPASGALAPSPALPLATSVGSLAAAKSTVATLAQAPTPLVHDTAPTLPAAPSPAPAANPSAPASVAAPATASSDRQNGNPAPLTSTINARLASGAAALVSQPRVALASLAPANEKAATKPASSDGGLPTNSRQLAPDVAHDGAEAPVAPAAHTNEPSLTPAKDNASAPLASLEAHEPAAPTHDPTVTSLDDSALNTSSPPTAAPVAQSAPPVNEAPVTLPVIPHAVAEQVAINVHQAVKSGTDHIQIQLQPADLGTIDVKLNVNHDGRVTVVVSADRSDTLNLLQQDAGGLTQALRDAGLQADNSSLSFNLRGGFQFQQQQSTGSGGGSRDSAYPSDGDGSDVIAAPLPSLRRHAGALDIHV